MSLPLPAIGESDVRWLLVHAAVDAAKAARSIKSADFDYVETGERLERRLRVLEGHVARIRELAAYLDSAYPVDPEDS